ncbi:MAG: hypothetical protein AB2A00_03635 [Myxococcota bacterium]
MKSMWTLSAVLAAALAVGCGGSKEEKKAEEKPATEQQAQAAAAEPTVAAPAQADLVSHCLQMREQLALCKEQAIDLLMDERAKANPEFAAKVADANQKATMRTDGLKELEADGLGPVEERTRKCTEVASKVPAQIPQSMMSTWEATKGCVDKPCGDRINCYRPFVAASMAMMK